MEIAMPSQKELIKSDFVRHLMFSEISEFLFLTDINSCYCLIHNWIPKKELLSISDERFFFIFASDSEEANQIKSYLHSWKPMSINEARRTKNVALARNGTARATDERVA